MFVKKLLLFLLFVFFSIVLYSQNTIDSTIYAIKKHDYFKAASSAGQIKNETIKKLFLYQINYYIDGLKEEIDVDTLIKPKNKKQSIVKKYLIADYYTINKQIKNDSLVFSNYLDSYISSVERRDSLLGNQILLKLNKHLLFRTRDSILAKKYVKEYEPYLKDNIDKFWYIYLQIAYQFLITENKMENVNPVLMDSLFNELYSFTNSNDHNRGSYFQLLGVYQANLFKDYALANSNFLKAKAIYEKSPYVMDKLRAESINYNMAINSFKNKNFGKAISFFRKDLLRDKEKKYIMFTNNWLYKCYDSLKMYDSAHYYFKQMINIKDKINEKEHLEKIRSIDGKYNYEKKEKELRKLAETNTELQQNVYTLLPILGVISVVLLLVYFLYRRYRKKSSKLEVEKSETLQKLDELKQIVIKNHIVLKDKTKVYIADLLYIKSDDHYLNIFLHEGKDHFVRGKLNQIIEELPPNFIRCHRSYIVNKNFIKQINSDTIVLIDKTLIPLSRSYKNKI